MLIFERSENEHTVRQDDAHVRTLVYGHTAGQSYIIRKTKKGGQIGVLLFLLVISWEDLL